MSASNLPLKRLYFIVFMALAVIAALFSMKAIFSVKDPGPPDEHLMITPENMLSDYDHMWRIIETQWPYLSLAEQGGYFDDDPINWRQRRDAYRKQLESPILISEDRYSYNGQVLGPNEFMVRVFEDSIAPFSAYGHLMVLDSDFYYPDFSPIDYSDKSRAFYEALPPAERTSDGEKAVSLYHVGDIPVIELKSFAGAYTDKEVKAQIEEIDSFCAQNIDSPNFIIDIRGNGGGNSATWQEGLRRIFLSKDAAFKRVSGIMDSSVDDYAAEGLTVVDLSQDSHELSPEITDSLTAAGLTHAAVKTFEREMIYNGSYLQQEDIPSYHGQVWLLTDSYVYSSAEMLAIFAKETGAATIVGAQTKGDGMSLEGTPKIHELPDSGLMFMCSRELPMNSDGSYNAFSGTLPDVPVKDGEDALNIVLKYIR